jgi:CRP-like cAMP-binding protein
MHRTSGTADERPAILVVEDNFLTASAVCDIVRDCGFALAGCVPRLQPGLDLLATRDVDGAIVDINLDGTLSYPLCVELRRRSVPFWFLTGYNASDVPPAFRDVPLISKPADPATIRAALASLQPHPLPASEPVSTALPTNLLLQRLAEEDRQALEPCLEHLQLRKGALLEQPGKPLDFVIFPLSGAVSMQAVEGSKIAEVALVGRQGLVGHSVLLGGRCAIYRTEVMFEGEALRAPATEIRRLIRTHARLRTDLLCGVDELVQQISRRALTNAHDTVEQRVARWLLHASDSLGTDELRIVHGTIAAALDVRRAGVTTALSSLEGNGALRSDRARVHILDPLRLGALAGAVPPAASKDDLGC